MLTHPLNNNSFNDNFNDSRLEIPTLKYSSILICIADSSVKILPTVGVGVTLLEEQNVSPGSKINKDAQIK